MQTNRRKFIRTSLAGLGAVTIVPGHVVFGKPGRVMPSDKVNIAFCGIGNRGGQILKDITSTGLVNNVAMCDTDMGAEHTLASIKAHPNAKQFQDFRVMFDKAGNSFDAVVAGVPDFAHFPITILAMSLGKHVYTEKPLTRTFQEAELLMKAAEKYKVVTQMGNQGHSEGNYFQFKSWVENGIIKDVTKVVAHMNSGRRWHGWDTGMKTFPKAEPIPETLDWDTWLGTAQYHDYNKDFINGQWRCWYDFGMGALGDWGAHLIDTVHEFLELGLPYEVDPVKIEGHNPLFYPQATTLDFKFPKRKGMPALTISWYDGVNNLPELPENYGKSELASNIPAASTGQIEKRNLNPGKIIYSKDLIFKGGSHGSTLTILPSDKAEKVMKHLPEVPESTSNHYKNFVLACKGEEKTRSPFEISGPLSQVFVLGTLAQRLNTKLKFDRETKQITNNSLANELLQGPPPRKGWEEFYRL
ncbi:Gfo/Idh/MocA family oxidoreductase [Maribellus sp. YY47]|uniref:Gfo/Idh/MocA family oxidoreductase n=1 Tax=Maribellus sp. YY47 TaxID=2929486 RepID=UPI00200141EF|nr:Gfo/Idh/MocA family oxidoreductase [Maribellus sp. YY47]MCK3683488.1 Gfo/Idh/MocA family oxidoreductase [Maribellus sp. YY47]